MASIPFADFGVKWFEDIVGRVTEWFVDQIKTGYEEITQSLFGTPLPEGGGTEVVFSPPASGDQPWHSIYQNVVAGEVTVFALVILFLAVQGRHFIRIFNVGSEYENHRTHHQAWTGGILIIAWYWVAVLSLYFVDALTIGLIPNVSEVGAAVLQILPVAIGNPILTVTLAAVGGLAMAALQAVYFIRELLIYVYLYGMPFGIAIAYGNVPVLSRIASQFCKQFIPLVVLPLPAAILFRGYSLLFVGDQLVTPGTAFLKYLVVVSLPVIALYLTWKTFRYASPLTARALGTATRASVTLGAVAGTGYLAGPRAATTTARWGVRAGAGQAAAQAVFSDETRNGTGGGNGAPQQPAGTAQDNVATDSDGHGGVPAYRRRENDPSYY